MFGECVEDMVGVLGLGDGVGYGWFWFCMVGMLLFL